MTRPLCLIHFANADFISYIEHLWVTLTFSGGYESINHDLSPVEEVAELSGNQHAQLLFI
jgi:hypothetical protein